MKSKRPAFKVTEDQRLSGKKPDKERKETEEGHLAMECQWRGGK